MKNSIRFVVCLFVSLACRATVIVAQDLQLATLGDFKLESGEVIHDCRVGYRTFGTLN